MADFKISFVQVFDSKPKALQALGAATTALPNHKHSMVDHSNQVQVRTVAGTDDKLQVIGDADDKPVFLVLSIAPD